MRSYEGKKITSPSRGFESKKEETYDLILNSAAHVRVIEETPAYWRVVFDYPPFNIVDATIFEALQDLLARMNACRACGRRIRKREPEFYLPTLI